MKGKLLRKLLGSSSGNRGRSKPGSSVGRLAKSPFKLVWRLVKWAFGLVVNLLELLD